MQTDLLHVTDEITAALRAGKPVVALESTIIAHGMPYPQNVETALAVEETVRQNGAVPATMAVVEGKIRIGLSRDHLELIATAPNVAKLSALDIAGCLADATPGALTVAGTLFAAKMAGIRVFATGGLGGVHRNLAEHFDISADLTELARTPIALVCAGCKSILDIPKTLEHLETLGIPVIGYGSDEFPAFYSRESGYRVNRSFADATQAAAYLRLADALAYPGGTLIANPIPAAAALPAAAVDGIINAACAEAEKQGVRGKALTPFLLAAIVKKTEGRSLLANIALVKNNAAVAAQIAKAYAASA